MAKSVGDSGPWLLPPEFLAEKENDVNADFGFPSEFPYEFGVSSPAVESVAGSTETESSDEDEDFLAGLTRRLSQSSLHESRKQLNTLPISTKDKAEDELTFSTKTRGFAGSPQSTLSGIDSWSGRSAFSGDGSPNGYSRVTSPSTAPFADSWDVIYEAAGQVARLKMNSQVSNFEFQNKPLCSPFGANFNHVQQQVKQKLQCGSVWGRQGGKLNWFSQQQQLQVQNRGREFGYENGKCNRPLSLPQPTWPPPMQVQHQNQQRLQFGGSGSRIVLPGRSSVKKGCGGTGVFLPRHYETPPEPRKKTGCAAPVLLPAKVVHALNLNLDELNAASQTRISSAFPNDYDALLARRNALLMQQRLSVRREEAANYEIRLPQEWTY